MSLTTLNLSPLDITAGQNFRNDTETIAEEFYNSIVAEGVKVPILIFKDEESGDYVLINGWRRWSAARRAVEQQELATTFQIPCILDTDVTDKEAGANKGLLDALTSKRHDPAQKSVAVYRLVEDKGLSVEDVSTRFGISMATVRRYVAMHQGAIPEVILAFERGFLNLEETHTLSTLAPDKQGPALEEMLNAADKKGALARIKRTVLRKTNKPPQKDLTEVMRMANQVLEEGTNDDSDEGLAARYALRTLRWVRGEVAIEELKTLIEPIVPLTEVDTQSIMDELDL